MRLPRLAATPYVPMDLESVVRRHAVGSDGLGQRHDNGGQDAWKHQRQGDGSEDLGLGGPADLAQFLQFGIDGAQGGGNVDVGKRVIVQRHAQHDGDGPVGKPVRYLHAEARQEAKGAGAFIAEHRQPGQRLAPGGDHIGDHHQHTQRLFPGNVGPDDQPPQHRSQRHRYQHREQAHDQRVFQRPPQRGFRHVAHQDITPVIQREISRFAADAPDFRFGGGKRGSDHLQKGDHDQAKQNDETEKNDHIKRIPDYVQKLIFQSFLCHGIPDSFLLH